MSWFRDGIGWVFPFRYAGFMQPSPDYVSPNARKPERSWSASDGRPVPKGGRPHNGVRECARRRGDWKSVSVIDAFKRYPYGINRRFPSITNPDRVDVDFQFPRVVVPAGTGNIARARS